MSGAKYRSSWGEFFGRSGLDRRRDHWTWPEGGAVLLVRPGPAETLARDFMAGLTPDGSHPLPRLELLTPRDLGRVAVSHTAIRREGGHAAEQVSQLHLGAPFEIWHEDGEGWALGCGVDRYPGWVRSWHLERGGGENPDGGEMVVAARSGLALAEPDPAARILHDLSFGTRIAPESSSPEFTAWKLPCGESAWTPTPQLRSCSPGTLPGKGEALQLLESWGESLVAVPYEWGGTTSWGFDCSGLIQILFGALGIDLPRDADQQAQVDSAGQAGSSPDPEAGALLFYGRHHVDHVGLLLPGNRLLHCRGQVQVEQLGERFSLGDLPLRHHLDPLGPSADRQR